MQTYADLVQFIQNGSKPVVTFQGSVEDLEGYAEAGMRARLVGARLDNDDVVKLLLDYSEFEAHNQPLESSNYYDKGGKANLNAREAGYYKPQDHIYVMLDQDISMYMSIDGDEALALFDEFKAIEPAAGSYIQWLESSLLAARRAQT